MSEVGCLIFTTGNHPRRLAIALGQHHDIGEMIEHFPDLRENTGRSLQERSLQERPSLRLLVRSASVVLAIGCLGDRLSISQNY